MNAVRVSMALGLSAAMLGSACSSADPNALRPLAPEVNRALPSRPDRAWADSELRAAVVQLRDAFSSEGAEGLRRLRLHDREVREMFTPEAAQRIDRLPIGLSPSAGEQRWVMFQSLARSALVGYCARGLRVAEPGGPEGFRERAFVVDRLLLVGREAGGVWGAWVEGLVLSNRGWRLLPATPYERQVETPRRDHSDVQLWDCELSLRPDRGETIALGTP